MNAGDGEWIEMSEYIAYRRDTAEIKRMQRDPRKAAETLRRLWLRRVLRFTRALAKPG